MGRRARRDWLWLLRGQMKQQQNSVQPVPSGLSSLEKEAAGSAERKRLRTGGRFTSWGSVHSCVNVQRVNENHLSSNRQASENLSMIPDPFLYKWQEGSLTFRQHLCHLT